MRLLGDQIANLLKHFPQCGGCKARKTWLNNVHAYAKEYGWLKALTDHKDRKLYQDEPR